MRSKNFEFADAMDQQPNAQTGRRGGPFSKSDAGRDRRAERRRVRSAKGA